MKLKINWYDIAILNIIRYYECPLCNYREQRNYMTETHIRKEHTESEIKEACSQ